MNRTIAPSAWGQAGRLYEESHRMMASILQEKTLSPHDAELHDPSRVASRMGELGLYKYLVPPSEERVHVRTLCTVREILGYRSPLADAVFAVQGLAMQPLIQAGRAELVEPMVAGTKIGGFALTEPEAGSDVASMRTVAKKDGDGWILDGDKTLISNVGIAHQFVVFANADPSLGKKGISAFFVPTSSPGLELVQIPMSGDHPLGRLVMRGCRLPASALLGNVGDGLRLALGTLEIFRTSVGAAALGMAWRAIDETLAHVTQRVQFGQRLSEFQLTQVALAEMVTELEAARLLVAATAWAKDIGKKDVGVDVAMAKMHATEAASRIIDRAVQLHGGLGVVLGSVVEQLYREVRPLRIYEGTTEVLKLLIGSSLIKRYTSQSES